jgi:hypothetical protein
VEGGCSHATSFPEKSGSLLERRLLTVVLRIKKIVEGMSGEVFVKVKEVGGRVVINRNAPGRFLFWCKADNSI